VSRAHGPIEPHQSDEREQAIAPPGLFVSVEHQSDCARFLLQVHDRIRLRREAELAGNR
jgi:hypothetical protein